MLGSLIRTFVYAALILQSCCSTSAPPLEQYQQAIGLSDHKFIFRPAILSDLDDITTVICDAFSPGPLWRYVFTWYDEFKHYHWRCLRKEISRQVDDDPPIAIYNNVISVFDGDREKVVSIASWMVMDPDTDQSNVDLRGLSHSDMIMAHKKCSDNLDANLTRGIDYDRQFSPAMEHYVENFPKRQMYLGLLATHPDWDGHGFGAMQVQWGMDKMKGTGVPLTLVGTPAGWPLYDSLGFESVANITITTLDWPENLWFEYMRYDTESK